MRVLVLGADGYLGWPTAMYLSARGHDVVAADSLIRRRWDEQLGTESLTPIASMDRRVDRWRELTGREIRWEQVDLCDLEATEDLIARTLPEGVVHYAEQRSAPYSMISARSAVETQVNNVSGTLNLLFALRDQAPDCHLVKLGTMGEYGTPNIDIEEGFLDIEHNGRRDRLPFPKQPGSFYHLSKVHDSHNIMFAVKIWGLRSTDLNQGVVYGTQTAETQLHPELVTRFDYDHIWGTVLNRFCVQAQVGIPLTVYGSGGQTRGFLDIRDTVRCIELALEHPAAPGEYRVFNQFTEQFNVAELADRVRMAREKRGLPTETVNLPNPRVEQEQHYYNAKHRHLLDLGLQPHWLADTLIEDSLQVVERYRSRIRPELIPPAVDWRGKADQAGTSASRAADGRTSA